MLTLPYLNRETEDKIRKIAQEIHCYPELSGQEVRTTQLLKEQLTRMGIEIIDCLPSTGVIGLIKGAYPGKTVALRADMDALPVQEDRTHTICSKNDGVMHACGHDIHTAALLGAAETLQRLQPALHGDILLLFQPAEEIALGAKAILESGVFDRIKPDAFFSFHVMPSIAAGQLGTRSGSIMAAHIGFEITISGKGGHGAAPHNTCDPIIAAARTVDALQSIVARENDPQSPLVLSVCSIHSGSSINIIPDEAVLSGSCRFLDNSRKQSIMNRVEQIAAKTAEVHNCCAETKFFRWLPAVDNNPVLLPVAKAAGSAVLGEENILWQNSLMVSEDFALFEEIAPIFMFHVGTGGPYPLHNSHFCVPEETVIQSAELFVQSALTYLDWEKEQNEN